MANSTWHPSVVSVPEGMLRAYDIVTPRMLKAARGGPIRWCPECGSILRFCWEYLECYKCDWNNKHMGEIT